jgi:hypothetical protein
LRSTIFNGVFMKKNVLSLSIAAAVAGFGMVGAAHAVTSLGGSSATVGGAAASVALTLQNGGIGQQLIVPYYTAQADNHTLLNLVNTDTKNGKIVKIRFRGAANSDDVLDFQVFMSPGDVWTADVSKDATTGLATLKTKDNTCMLPEKAAGAGATTTFPFGTIRLDPTLTGDALAAGTREGYVEILNMADVPPTAAWSTGNTAIVGGTPSATQVKLAGVSVTGSTANPLFTALKHVGGVAPCGATITALLDLDPAFTGDGVTPVAATKYSATGTVENGMTPPTTGLMANWTIINIVGAAAWSGSATALSNGGTGNVVYFPQTGTSSGNAVAAKVGDYTADPLLRADAFRLDTFGTLDQGVTAAIKANQNDLPDMSTPYGIIPGATTTDAPRAQALATTGLIASTSSTNEYLTDKTISASTDWVFSMPTRRYSTSLNYAKIGAMASTVGTVDSGIRFTNLNPTADIALGDGAAAPAAATLYRAQTAADATAVAYGYFTKNNASTVLTTTNGGRQICVNGIKYSYTDREEAAATTGASLSPTALGAALLFCGEDSVISVNLGTTTAPTQALKASVTQKDISLPTTPVNYVDGWMTLATPGLFKAAGATFGLPVLGGAFFKASAGANSFGTYTDFRN